jgi:GNAT superfamily N-acetyltransferase
VTAFTIRPAEARDAGAILELIRALATYEREPHAVVATEADLVRDGFGERPRFHVLLAESGGARVGFAFYFFVYSTWEGRPALHLEDLFVIPSARRLGIGMAFMRELAKISMTEGATRFQWNVLDWNAPAIAFYERLGARLLPEWRVCRLDGRALSGFAAADEP